MEILIAFSIVLLVLVGSHFFRKPNPIDTTRKGATDFLSQTSEWVKWMAGIQTAALGFLALAVLDKDYLYGRNLNDFQRALAVFSFVFLGAALLASAWVLSSIPSQSIRLHAIKAGDTDLKPDFDIYEQPLYGWMKDHGLGKNKSTNPKTVFTFSYLLIVKHTFWILGLFSVAGLAITIYLTPPPKNAAPEQSTGSYSAQVMPGPSAEARPNGITPGPRGADGI